MRTWSSRSMSTSSSPRSRPSASSGRSSTRHRPTAAAVAAASSGHPRRTGHGAAMALRIGISGWRYPPWRGVFYPPGLVQRRELEYASSCFNSIELNGSFYSLQRPSSYAAWREATPEGFVFAIKGPRYITHMRRLREVREPLANFLASGLLALGPKLGPVLWQLPPSLPFDAALLDGFLGMLPHDTGSALRLAGERDADRMRDRSWLEIGQERPLRHALEVRHHSFWEPGAVARRRADVLAPVCAPPAGRGTDVDAVTAVFRCLRRDGDDAVCGSGGSAAALDRRAERIAGWAAGSVPGDARRVGGAAPA